MGYVLPKGNAYIPLDAVQGCTNVPRGQEVRRDWGKDYRTLIYKKAFARAFSAEARYFLLHTQKKVPKEKGAPVLSATRIPSRFSLFGGSPTAHPCTATNARPP
jgi:hypothetical protein